MKLEIGVDFKAMKKAIENNRRLKEQADKAQIRALYRGSALVMRIAKQSIKRRAWKKIKAGKSRGRKAGRMYVHDYLRLKTAISNPGDPPRAHTASGEFGLKSMGFIVDHKRKFSNIGPFGKGPGGFADKIEKGGVIGTKIPWWAQEEKNLPRVIQKKIAARPFMAPALEKFKDKYPKIFQDTIG
jgi:hypothetical protein